MTQPRLLDLFCGAGGAATGYHRAGFEVVGVDINPQARFPFEFHQADAMTYPLDGFDVIHASPPCQPYSRAMKHLAGSKPMLIDAMRERLEGLSYVIENVPGSPLPTHSALFGPHGVELCGTGFGLRIHRHRYFEASVQLKSSGCRHDRHAVNPHNQAGRDRIYSEFGRGDPEKVWRMLMGVDWMSKQEARESIPPAYTEYIGGQLLEQLEVAA